MSNISVTTTQQVIDVTNTSGITVTTPEGQTIDVTVPNSSVSVTNTTDDITVVNGGIVTFESGVKSVNGNTGPAVVLTTDNINEGTTNQYFTNARARSSISATDTGGDGSLSYDSSTGVITYTGPSASEVRAHFSAGTGVTINSGQISIGQAVAVTDSVTFNNVAVTTNLRLNGDKIFNSTNDEFIRLVKDINGTKFIEFGEPGNYDVSLYPEAVVYKGDVAQTTSSITLATTAADQVIDQYDKISQRASNYVVQIRAGTEYEIWEGMLLHDGTNVITNSYGELRTGLTSLATITADISGDYVRLLATPTYANTTFRLFKTIFEE